MHCECIGLLERRGAEIAQQQQNRQRQRLYAHIRRAPALEGRATETGQKRHEEGRKQQIATGVESGDEGQGLQRRQAVAEDQQQGQREADARG